MVYIYIYIYIIYIYIYIIYIYIYIYQEWNIPKAKPLLECTKKQGSKGGTTGTSWRKIILAHPESFQHFSITCQDLLKNFSEDKL